MLNLKIDTDLLHQFEANLDPKFPEKNKIPTRILDYGEMSMVFELDTVSNQSLAYKRMSMFKNLAEAEAYTILRTEYVNLLQNDIGVQTLADETVTLTHQDKIALYVVQQKLPAYSIAHKAIHYLTPTDINRLLKAILREMKKVFDFNLAHKGQLEIGFDGQISNWAIIGFNPQTPSLNKPIDLIYFDTGAPFLQRKGTEQLDSELFLRSMPFFMVWVARLFFLNEIMTRYYDFRWVVVDLIANFYKEQRPDLIPMLVETVNQFFATEIKSGQFKTISLKEVKAYYREDAFIWRLYLKARRLNRFLYQIMGKQYVHVLPRKVNR